MVVVCPWGFLGASEPAQQQQKESPLAAVTNTQEQLKAMLENEQQNKASYADIAKKGGATQVEIAENALNGSSDASNRRISFAEKVKANASVEIDIAALPIPGMKGNIPSIRIPKQAIDRGLQFCKFSLVGRLDFQKINIDTVRTIAAEKWRPKGCWKIVPLGKGYFMIRLTCEEDLVRIWSGGPWKFENQILRLTKWKPDFDPEIQRISHAMVWVKLPKLKQQFWDYEILMAMGRCIGYPIGIDKTTAARDFGFYASVLVDLDRSKPIPTQIIVEVPDGQDFIQEIELSRLPKFCSHCKTIGHLMSDCKSLQKEIRNEKDINLEKEPRKENQHATEAANHRRRRNRNRQNNNWEAGTSGDQDSQGVPIPTPISTGTGDTLPENVVGLEAGEAQTQEAGTDHVDAIPQVGVAENIAIDAVALLPLAVEMQSVHLLNAPQAAVTATNCSLAVANPIVPQENSRAADSYSPIARTMKSGALEPDSSSMTRMVESDSSSNTGDGNRLKLLNETNSLLRSVNWADLADDDENVEDGKEPWQKIAMKKYKPAWMSQEHIDDDDNSQDGDEPWQFQKGKDVDLTPLPPRARKIPARYK